MSVLVFALFLVCSLSMRSFCIIKSSLILPALGFAFFFQTVFLQFGNCFCTRTKKLKEYECYTMRWTTCNHSTNSSMGGTVVVSTGFNTSILSVKINVTTCIQLLSLDNVVAKILQLLLRLGKTTEYKVPSTFLVWLWCNFQPWTGPLQLNQDEIVPYYQVYHRHKYPPIESTSSQIPALRKIHNTVVDTIIYI